MSHIYRTFNVDKRELIDTTHAYAGQEGDASSTTMHFEYSPYDFDLDEYIPHIMFDVRDDDGNPMVFSPTSTASFDGYEFDIPWELTVRIKKPAVRYQLFFVRNDVDYDVDDIPRLKSTDYLLSKPDEIFLKPSIMPKRCDNKAFSPATEPSTIGWIELWKKYGLIWPVKTSVCEKTGEYKLEFTTYADGEKHEVTLHAPTLDSKNKIHEHFLPFTLDKCKSEFPSSKGVPTSKLLKELLDDIDDEKQVKLKAGSNITIEDNVISATGEITGTVNFKDILGYPSENERLMALFDQKENKLTKEQKKAVDSGITKDKVRLYDANLAQSRRRAYAAKKKIKPFFYEMWYNSVDYDQAYEYFKNYASSSAGKWYHLLPPGCTSVRKGNFFGRNMDWYYSNMSEFVVHTPAYAGRYASVGIAGGLSGLTEDFIKSRENSELYDILPFMMYDGINENGVVASMNVVSMDVSVPDAITPEGATDSVYDLMLIRYVLDNFSSAEEAKNFIINNLEIKTSKALLSSGYYVHYMIADISHTYVLESYDGKMNVVDVDGGLNSRLSGKPYMTNFHLYKMIPNDDGTVYTPATMDAEHDAVKTNKIPKLGSGLERYNLVALQYQDMQATKAGVRELLDRLAYTRAYRGAPEHAVPEWLTEFVGEYRSHPPLYVDTPASEYEWVMDYTQEEFARRSRDNPTTWQTVHSSVFDILQRKFHVIVQEDGEELEFRI